MLALYNSFTQGTRLLQLNTPLGADKLLAECVRGEEGISSGYSFSISALSTDEYIELKSLLGQPALLQLGTAGSSEPRPFHGHVTAIEHCGANGGFARYQITLQPWAAFLARGRDSRVFQDKNVFDILEAVFASYQGKGKLAPAWRFEIADRSIYPIRSHTCQYQESDLAFSERLMQEEGLFHFFEHVGAPDSPGLGSHTMVIADHNGAFRTNAQGIVRFTQPGAVMKEDSMDRWRTTLRQGTNAIELSSWDYRSISTRPVSAGGATGGADMPLVCRDVAGAYAYGSRAQGQRIADNQMQALIAARTLHTGAGTVRTFSPGTIFTLTDHAMSGQARDGKNSFLIVRAVHLMHNNLSAELKSHVFKHLKPGALDIAIGKEHTESLHATGSQAGERPLYRNRIDAIDSEIAYRASGRDERGCLLHPRPSVHGQQTAIVVGPAGSVIHTDRDHRIKVQFHWQRGAQSHSRLEHPAPDGQVGAPADDSTGTWVRVATPMAPIAGSNWGSNAVPRVGQEVLLDFLEGDIDRPVVIGSLYNGRGQDNAQNNQVGWGAGVATGNAPAWFPGDAKAHAHPAALSGMKSQSMNASQLGTGAYSQLVFDDSTGQSRVSLQRHASPHKGTAELNMGHLRHQTDNQRLNPAGFGAELKTEHSTAVRAGAGLLISTHARANATGSALDSSEAKTQIDQSLQLQMTLGTTAQKHNSSIKDSKGLAEPRADKLTAIADMAHSVSVIETVASGVGGSSAILGNQGGGVGKVTAYAEPHLQLSSAAGIAATTPVDAIFSAGTTGSITAGHDINFAAQGSSHALVADGIALFTYGKADSKDKPNQETGIRLHAASGKLVAQSQSDETHITADKSITVASITKSVGVAAKEHLLLTAQGAYIKLEGGNIMIHGPGSMTFKGSMKELSGPAKSIQELPVMPLSANWPDVHSQQLNVINFIGVNPEDGNALVRVPYSVRDKTGRVITSGTTDELGDIKRIFTKEKEKVDLFLGDGEWRVFADVEHANVTGFKDRSGKNT